MSDPAKRAGPEALEKWMKREERTRAWLAGKCGISEPSLSRILNGLQVPSIDTAFAIERVTGVEAKSFALTSGEEAA